VSGFTSKPAYRGGHDDGPTSVDEALGLLYVTDRTAQSLVTVDVKRAKVVGRTALASEPDYVRFAAATRELWVTEPGAEKLEIFALESDGTPRPTATVPITNGPESLVFDARRGRAYTHRWEHTTVVLDVARRSVVAEWPNGCQASRGIALDEARGLLFAACSEGTVSVLDLEHDGRLLSKSSSGSGFDVMGYSPALGHLYLAGGRCSCFVVLGVDAAGTLKLLGREKAPPSTHCATADDQGHAWVCNPAAGELWRFDDGFPKSS
jgi:DNA-binding beta-propeller fold protein YncE